MCGRYHIESEETIAEMREIIEEINRKYSGTNELTSLKTGEIRPTNTVPIIGKDGPELMTWSYYNAKIKRPVINARTDKPAWDNVIKSSRIAVPTNGFYEWTHPGGKTGDKYLFMPEGPGSMLYLAGIYVYYSTDDGQRERRFVILTTDANASMEPYHDRMPVYVGRDEVQAWVGDAAATQDILHRAQPRYNARLVDAKSTQQMSLF